MSSGKNCVEIKSQNRFFFFLFTSLFFNFDMLTFNDFNLEYGMRAASGGWLWAAQKREGTLKCRHAKDF